MLDRTSSIEELRYTRCASKDLLIKGSYESLVIAPTSGISSPEP